MKRFLIVAAAVLAMLVASLSFTSGAGASNPSITPKVGHYEGRDTHHRHIRFYYGSHGQVINFRVEHTAFPPATSGTVPSGITPATTTTARAAIGSATPTCMGIGTSAPTAATSPSRPAGSRTEPRELNG